MFETVLPNKGLRFATMDPDRVALSIQQSRHGHPKAMLVLGRGILQRLGVKHSELITVEVDRIVGQLRVSKGSGWRIYKWGETGTGSAQLTAALLGIPTTQHSMEDLKHGWDPEGRLLIVLPQWAKPTPKANGKAA